MSSNGKFAAQILETSAVGYAGLTASLLLDRHPEIAGRYEPDGFSSWKAQLRQWLLDLSAAVDADEPRLFEARMMWTRRAFEARGASTDDLRAALEALRDTLRERLPEASIENTVSVVDRALAAVADPDADGGREAASPPGRAALVYLESILKGQPREALDRLLASAADEAGVRAAYLDVLLPAQREAGRMWHAGELSIAEEHLVTRTTQRAMALLCEKARGAAPNGKTVVLASVAGNVHDVAIAAIGDFFEIAGWRAINLGPDVPHEEIGRSVAFFDADVVVLAAVLDPHVKSVQRSIERVRAVEDRDVKILVGGPAFERVAELWRKVGADGYAAHVEEAEPLASELTR